MILAQPPGVLVIDGRDPRQAEYASLLYGAVQELVRKGATSQSIHVLDLGQPVVGAAYRLTAFNDVKIPPPFLAISQPTRRVLSGRELETFSETVTRLNQPPKPPPPPPQPSGHGQADPHPPQAQHRPPLPPPPLVRMSNPSQSDGAGTEQSVAQAQARPNPPQSLSQPPESSSMQQLQLKMSTDTTGVPKRSQEKTVDVENYKVSRTIEQPEDE